MVSETGSGISVERGDQADSLTAYQAGQQWLENSAQNGNNYAAYRLGKEYLRGKIAREDANKTAHYFYRAANDAGNLYAQYMLGKLFLTGEGVPKDKGKAQCRMQAAAEQGHRYAQLFVGRWDTLRQPSVMLSATRLLHHMSGIFQERTPLPPVSGGLRIDRKRFTQLAGQKGYQAAKSYVRGEEEQQYTGPAM